MTDETKANFTKFANLMGKYIKDVKTAPDYRKHYLTQTIAAKMDDLSAQANGLESVYDYVLGEMPAWHVQVMSADDFGLTKKELKDFNDRHNTNDRYFVDESFDGVTPYALTAKKLVSDLASFKNIAESVAILN